MNGFMHATGALPVSPEENFDLSARNTLALPSHARYGATVTTVGQLGELLDLASAKRLPLHVIGGGSNLVLHEEIEAVVAVMATRGTQIVGDSDDEILVAAQAGEDWSAFVEWTVAQGLAGLENLAGIPGTVGAAPVQNIGAYGLELKDRFHSLTAYDIRERALRSFSSEDCGFRYRHSIFKEKRDRYIVTDVTFALPKKWLPVLSYSGLDVLTPDADAAAIMNRVLALRGSKLPDWRSLPNAGSFFHNPVVTATAAGHIEGGPHFPQPDGRVKLSAAWLIEACGLKGVRQGQAGIYEHHALIVVNHGGATYRDIAALSSRVKKEVFERFGVELTQEPIELQ